MDRWLQEMFDNLYAKMTPAQIEDFERRLREEIARFDAWVTKPKARKARKQKATTKQNKTRQD
jgi:hypothetical protein